MAQNKAVRITSEYLEKLRKISVSEKREMKTVIEILIDKRMEEIQRKHSDSGNYTLES